jgi:hypothetical protein
MVEDPLAPRLGLSPMNLVLSPQGYKSLVEDLVVEGQTPEYLVAMIDPLRIGVIIDLNPRLDLKTTPDQDQSAPPPPSNTGLRSCRPVE